MLSESDSELQEIYLHSLPIKEYQIVDYFLPKLKDEVMKVDSSHDDKG
jgi:small subunit ribosomal protein S2e